MPTQLQFRRGTTAQNNAFTGAIGEISIDTDTENIRVHDGSQAGGFEIVPSGTVVPYGGTSAPGGWQLCDDSAISRTTYARLFAIIGTAYGTGDGSTTFNVPDLRDRVPLGKGTNNATLGTATTGAAASSVMASATKSGVTTATNTTGSDGDGDLTVGTTTVAASAKDSSTTTVVNSVNQAAHTHSIPALSVDDFTVNTTLPNQVFNYIIKL
tara:strand:+ start:269 stop:904 length:636 start_codon:yes stop_codon:yes gene_type:complete